MRKQILALLAAIAMLATVLVVGSVARADAVDECVPQDAWTEVIEHPEVSHEETVVVVDVPAIPAVPGQHYSLKGNSGIDKDEVPPTPDVNPAIWTENSEQEPPGHHNSTQQPDGSPYTEGESGLHYASHGSSGNRDWFFYRAPVAEQPAVTHEETIVVIDEEAWTEVIEHEAVTCPEDPTDPVDPTDPTDPVDPVEPTDPVDPTEPPVGLTPPPIAPDPYCLGGALVIVTIDADGNTSTSHINGHPDCNSRQETAVEEGF